MRCAVGTWVSLHAGVHVQDNGRVEACQHRHVAKMLGCFHAPLLSAKSSADLADYFCRSLCHLGLQCACKGIESGWKDTSQKIKTGGMGYT